MPASRRKLMRWRPATPGSERACSASSHATSKHSASGSAAFSQRSMIAAGTSMPGTFSSM